MGNPDPPDQHLGIRGPLGEIGGQVDRDHAPDISQTNHLDAQLRADRPSCVTGEQVGRPDGELGAARPFTDDRGDAVVVLLEGDQLVAESHHPGRELLGMPAHDGLEADLGEVGRRPRARCLPIQVSTSTPPGLEPPDPPPGLRPPGEARVERRVGHVGARGGLSVDRFGRSGVSQDLHRSLVEYVSFRENRGRRKGAH